MDKAYSPITWENRPSTASPVDEINMNAISRGLGIVDDRVIDLDTRVKDTIKNITFDSNTGLMTVTKENGTPFNWNLSASVMNVISDMQRQTATSFEQVASNFSNVQELLDQMDLKIDMTAEGANAGLRDVQTTITENDGYYRREMSGIRDNVASVSDNVNAIDRTVTTFSSSITQTTRAIQLSVQELTEYVDDSIGDVNGVIEVLRSDITQTAGQIALKVSKRQIINGLAEEFGTGISLTPDRLTIASDGAMVVNTRNFKLDEDGNAKFSGHVDMESGSVGGVPLIRDVADDSNLNVDHANNAWKLRSFAIDKATDLRYYTYMTKKKHLIVSDDAEGGHSEENDVTDDCTVGSKSYPWQAGYFKQLFVNQSSVIPEVIALTLSDWSYKSAGGYYYVEREINGLGKRENVNGKVYLNTVLSVYPNFDINPFGEFTIYTNADDFYDCAIEVHRYRENTVRFYSFNDPGEISVLLSIEEVYYGVIQGADITVSFNNDSATLAANWESPDTTESKYISWVADELVIEKWDEDNLEWVLVDTETEYNGEPFAKDAFVDTPLIVGG